MLTFDEPSMLLSVPLEAALSLTLKGDVHLFASAVASACRAFDEVAFLSTSPSRACQAVLFVSRQPLQIAKRPQTIRTL